MKILFFVDLHGDMKALREIKERANDDVDVVVCAGDFTTMERGMGDVLKELNSLGKKVLMIHGNHEDEDGLREACENFENILFIHKAVHHIGEYIFLGYGGDGFSTNDKSFERVADEFFKHEALGKKRIILVTHGPPHGTILDDLGGDFRGNKSYKKFIDEVKPHVVVAGHLHENAGKHERVERTLYMNPGKNGVVLDI